MATLRASADAFTSTKTKFEDAYDFIYNVYFSKCSKKVWSD